MAQYDKPVKPSYYAHVLLVIILVLLSVSIYTIIHYVVRKPPVFEEVMMCSDKECGHVFIISHSTNEAPPFVCKKCGKKTSYKAFRCSKCMIYFPNDIMNSEIKLECPKCGKPDNVEDLPFVPAQDN